MTRKISKAYGLDLPLVDVPPLAQEYPRAPTAADKNFSIGFPWIYKPTADTASMYNFGGLDSSGDAIWMIATPGASDVDTLTGDGGGAISPLLGNITLAGGTNITTAGAANTITFNMDAAIVLATSVTAPLYTAAAADAVLVAGGANDVVVRLGDNAGATFFRVQDSDSADVYTVDSDGAHTAFAGLTVTGAFTQTAGTFNAGADAAANAINIGTGAAAKVVTIGSVTGASSMALNVGTGNFALEGNVASAYAISNTGANTGIFQMAGGTGARTVNIANGGTGIKTVNIATSATADVISIGDATGAGSLALDAGTGGFSLDATGASNITVTTAGTDLDIQGVGGAVNISSTQAENDAVTIDASAANGGVQISAGTGGVLIGNQADCTGITLGLIAPTATRDITIGGGTVVTAAVTDTINVGTGGATTNANSIKTVNINTGGVTLGEVLTHIGSGAVTSGTHTVNIQSGNAAAGTVATNISTGTGTKTVNVGNADANTTINLDGAVAINTDVNATFTLNAGTSTGTVTIGNIANTGAIAVATSSTLDLDGAGQVSINSSAAPIAIGDDAVAQNINIGTGAAARTITVGNISGASSVVVDVGTGAASFGASATAHTTTIGSTTGASATVIQSGTGGLTVTGTVQDLTANFIRPVGEAVTFTQSPITGSALDTAVAATGATGDINLLSFQDGIMMEQFVLGAGQTIIKPVMTATGLLISGDETATEGFEYNWGAARANSKHAFTIGTSPAFYLQWRFRADDISGLEPCYCGFRKTQANQVTGQIALYTDFVAYGLNDGIAPGDACISTQLNTGGLTNTDCNDAWADAATHTLRINVSAAGVVTFLFDGAPPTATQAFTFDTGDVVHPFFRHEFNAALPDAIEWISMECGYQA
jgi:hypothetical protein